jgi:hypothetical protein
MGYGSVGMGYIPCYVLQPQAWTTDQDMGYNPRYGLTVKIWDTSHGMGSRLHFMVYGLHAAQDLGYSRGMGYSPGYGLQPWIWATILDMGYIPKGRPQPKV